MPYIRKRGKTWQAIVRLKGSDPVASTHETKRAAELWAQGVEADIRAGRRGLFPAKTVADAFTRYSESVATQKRSGDWEVTRLAYMLEQSNGWRSTLFHAFSSADAAAWRDERLKTNKPSTVGRDLNLLRYVWNIGAKEWKWCGDNPWSELRIPGVILPRASVWGWRQIRAMCRRMDYVSGEPPKTMSEEVAYAFLLSLRTGMRQSEVMGLTGESVDLARATVRLSVHKTLERVGTRTVPLSSKAVRLLMVIHRPGPLFTTRSCEALFRKYRQQLGIEGLTFHDARATFCTIMARRVDVLTLAKITGHKDPKQLMTYYRATAEDIARTLG